MGTYILLFRALNAGAGSRVAMDDLIGFLNRMGIHDVAAWGQDGNIALRCSRQQANGLARRVSDVLREWAQSEPRVMLLRIQDLEHAVAANPFRDAVRDPESLQVWFLAGEPAAPEFETLEALKGESERFQLDRKTFYLHTPGGPGESRVAARVEQALGVEATCRDWRSITKTLETAWQLS